MAVPRFALKVTQLCQNTRIACGFDQKSVNSEVLSFGVDRSRAGMPRIPESVNVHTARSPRHGDA